MRWPRGAGGRCRRCATSPSRCRGRPAGRTPRAGSSRSTRRSTRPRCRGRTRGTRCRAARRASCCGRSRARAAAASRSATPSSPSCPCRWRRAASGSGCPPRATRSARRSPSAGRRSACRRRRCGARASTPEPSGGYDPPRMRRRLGTLIAALLVLVCQHAAPRRRMQRIRPSRYVPTDRATAAPPARVHALVAEVRGRPASVRHDLAERRSSAGYRQDRLHPHRARDGSPQRHAHDQPPDHGVRDLGHPRPGPPRIHVVSASDDRTAHLSDAARGRGRGRQPAQLRRRERRDRPPLRARP